MASLQPCAAAERQRLRRLYDIAPSRILHALCVLGIPDAIPADGIAVSHIAGELGLNTDALRRLLRSAAALDVVAWTRDGRVVLTEAGELLREGAPAGLRAEFSDNDLFIAWDEFAQTIRSGVPSYQTAFGRPVFDRVTDNPRELRVFQQHMRERAVELYGPLVPQVVATGDTTGDTDFVDVGGGLGGLSEMLLEASARARCVVVDLPEVIDQAGQLLRGRSRDRIELVAADMFKCLPEGHATYIYASVLHDWSDKDAVHLLELCRTVMQPDGRVLVLDRVLGEGDRLEAALGDIWMLAMTGGRERDREDWQELALRAGFIVSQVHPGAQVSLIELRPAQ